MHKFYLCILVLLPLTVTSQTLQGIVFDEEATVKGAKIVNITQNILSYSDGDGNFKIEARANDSLMFQSLFHLEQTFIPQKKDFNETIVIVLKKAVNELDEVLVKKEPDAKEFDPVETNVTLKNQILEDIKRNPHLYSKTSTNMDIIALIGMVAKLFKSKQPKAEGPTYATYDDLVHLFETDGFFTPKLLKIDLNIPEDYKNLFFQYCEAHNIDFKLLDVSNRFFLLDRFITCSNEFHEILKEAEKE